MAELAARPGDFSVKVQVRIGHRQDFRRVRKVANQIQHRAVGRRAGRAKRQTENGTKMVFKLAGDGSFDGLVAGIVDARCHLIGQQ